LSNLKYRNDIQGLRAIAVLSVILFHMNPNWIPGGFLGVDIFFVISGFLITTIIYSQISEGNFSFFEFYNRRMKRILPAFFTVTIACLIVGYFLMLPSDYVGLGKSALSTIFFASNLYFAKTAGGYFEANETLPLLHTWSLAVEEQYYFIAPILLVLLTKFGVKPRALVYTLVAVAVISFAGATVVAISDTSLAAWNYYMLPSRAGELLVGSILALLLHNGYQLRISQNWSIAGALLILLSFILINGESVFPGVNALWACLGAAFIIFSKPSNIINRCLSIKPLTYIGLISYSLYLWHWPVLAFLKDMDPNISAASALTNTQLLFAGLLTWLLAHLTYKLIELKTKSVKTSPAKTFIVYLAVPSLFILVIAGIIIMKGGIPSRFDNFVIDQASLTPKTMCSMSNERGCVLSPGEKEFKIALVGDSHAQALETFFQLFGQMNDYTIYDYASPNCAPARPIQFVYAATLCTKSRKALQDNINTIDVVFLVGRWDDYFFATFDNSVVKQVGPVPDYGSKLESEINDLKSNGVKKIIIVNQVPKYYKNINKLQVHPGLSSDQFNLDRQFMSANEKIAEIANKSGAFVVDFSPIFCNQNTCSPFDDSGRSLYYDDDHLSIYGSKWLFEQYLSTRSYQDLIEFLAKR
jgi:peptidoglycan/LPS O-acetylase OafA/YrhL